MENSSLPGMVFYVTDRGEKFNQAGKEKKDVRETG
jgi:hypothetical protein